MLSRGAYVGITRSGSQYLQIPLCALLYHFQSSTVCLSKKKETRVHRFLFFFFLKVGVFSPSHRNHYLNVTPNNLLKIYPPDGVFHNSQASHPPPVSHLVLFCSFFLYFAFSVLSFDSCLCLIWWSPAFCTCLASFFPKMFLY